MTMSTGAASTKPRNFIFVILLGCYLHFHTADAASHVCTSSESYRQRYKTKCGFLNLGRCTRHRTKYRQKRFCCSGWKSVDSSLACDRAICNGKIDPTACDNYFSNSHIIYSDGSVQRSISGTCSSPNKCICNKEGFYSAGGTCEMCSAISKCNLETCSNRYNQVCARCEGVIREVPGYRAYVVSSNRKACTQACSWRSDSTPCYPGSCSAEVRTSCRCTSGFSGTKCDRISTAPSINENILSLTASNGDKVDAPSNINGGPPQAVVWTNIVSPTNIKLKFTSDYRPNVPERQPYITDFKAGVIAGRAEISRRGRNSGTVAHNCGGSQSRSNPEQGMFTCEATLTNLSPLKLPFVHKDALQFSMTATNGGFVKVRNTENGIVQTNYLTGRTANHTFEMRFDTVVPYHCKPQQRCNKNMLTDVDLSTKATQTFSWDGWMDADSGIKDYSYELFELKRKGEVLGVSKRVQNGETASKSASVTFPNSAVYAMILTAHDNAGNTKSARKLVIFDSASAVTTTQNSVLRATSALASTNYLWQNDLSRVTFSWTNRYVNTIHHNGRFLASVESYPGIPSDYDDYSGVRRTAAIKNIQGIIKFRQAYGVDHEGGRTVLELSFDDFKELGLAQETTVRPTIKDGDTLVYYLRAYDVLSAYKEEILYVNFDSSRPVIENLWLTKGDTLDLAVHGYEELDKMVIEWVAFDVHSGIEEVEWKILDHQTKVEHGSMKVPPQGETSSLAECKTKYKNYARGQNCYCIPTGKCYHRHFQIKPKITTIQGEGITNNQGVHDHDYRIVITVRNVAKLSTTVTKKITIDTTPPHAGTVHDGKSGEPEVDFQSDSLMSAHWEGFFDRESGVRFYQYGFATSCLDSSKFAAELNDRQDVIQTTATHAQWTAPSAGKYYVTVVAYNRALEPSVPVCSDGVVIDKTRPTVTEIDLEGSRIKGGLVQQSNKVYYISDSRRRYLLTEPDQQCRNKAVLIEDSVSSFPLEKFHNGSVHAMPSEKYCNKDGMPYTYPLKIYLSMHSHINVNWTGNDTESGVYDFEFGLASDQESVLAPDLLPFTTTHHHTWYTGYHPQLSDGTEFFISVKATNKAGLTTVESLGPIIVHTIPPAFNGKVTVSLENDILLANWAGNGKISDPESTHLTYKAAVGSSPGAQDIVPYSALSSAGSCRPATPPSCTAFTKDLLHWDLHHNFTYYVSIQVENIVGLHSVFTSDPYVHNTRLPANGVVYEVVRKEEIADFMITELDNSNFQINRKELKARWFGFESDELSEHVSYRVSLGSEPGSRNLADVNVGTATEHNFLGLNLILHKTYFVTVTAKTDAGTRRVSSNGVTIVRKNTDLNDQVFMHDGRGCNQQDDGPMWLPNHHTLQNENMMCQYDIDFQRSTTVYNSNWNVSTMFQHIYPDVTWKLQVKQANTDDIWNDVEEKKFLTNTGHISQPAILESCRTYRSSVRFCAGAVCSLPVVSDGVTVLSEPNKPSMKIQHENLQGSQLTVTLTYTDQQSKEKECSLQSTIDKYMWSLTDNKPNSHLFTKWKKVGNLNTISTNQFQFILSLEGEVDFSECRRLAVRIFNKAGLSTVVSSDIKNCSAIDPIQIVPSTVIDVLGPPASSGGVNTEKGRAMKLEQNAAWFKPDVDYIPYSNIISAVWPTLRHRNYSWGLIEDESFSTQTHFMSRKQIIRDPCSHPGVIVCGNTDKEFVNAFPVESLKHGRRYHICIHADARNASHEKWTEDLPEVSACSDGVTVDLTPPTGGQVWVGNLANSKYQTSSSDVAVFWDRFTDVEENGGTTVHPSGISHYKLAIGSIEGGEDVVAKSDVGLINHKIFHALSLQNGHTYFATVQAVDFVNRSTTVYSKGFILDNTPPMITSKPVQFTNTYIQTTDVLSACWTGSFKDSESGISKYMYAVGNRPGHQDVKTYSPSMDDCVEARIAGGLRDGHTYYVTVQAMNGAGMTSTLISRPLTVDSTPPIPGHVLEVIDTSPDENDIDYITSQSKLSVRWEGFHDPHSDIKHYKVMVGVCDGCDDIVQEFEAGSKQFYTFHHLKMTPGTKYITTVTACNMADMCTSVSSDGVVVDLTPPVTGQVLDGTKDLDIEYQAVRNFFGAKFNGFEDPESGIERYEWRVGTTAGGEELFKPQALPVIELAYQSNIPDNKQLPVNTRIYITVRCYNKAGLYSEATSNGFIVDTTLPVTTKKPVLSSTLASVVDSTSVSRSSLKVEWKFTDDESNIERQYISLSPHLLGDFNTSAMEIPSVLTEYILPDLDLHDGSKYNIKLIGCNLAGLCQSSVTDSITVDSTPPTRGMFAIGTGHAAGLHRDKDEWIYWSKSTIQITWLGFSDLHTGISEYHVAVGNKPFSTDLNKDGRAVSYPHDIGSNFDDEGMVQKVTIQTKRLQMGKSVFIAVWAVNGVGLKSHPILSEFELVEGGMLELVRRCQAYDCAGHCVCAAQDRKCSIASGCSDLSKANPNNIVDVKDIIDFKSSAPAQANFSPDDTFLGAKWSVTNQQGAAIIRYEVSAGHSDQDSPTGIFTDRTWYDVGQNMDTIISLPRGKVLEKGSPYSVFVRAWYDENKYAIFKSPGIIPITSAPSVGHVAGVAIKELASVTSTKDIDSQTSKNKIIIGWKNKFRGGIHGLNYFEPYISTHPQGHNVHQSADKVSGEKSVYTASGLNLEENRVYYSTVLSYGQSDLVSWANSDGVIIDNTPPSPGIVHDGNDIKDKDYESSTSTLSASWYGFTDSESGIVNYFVCAGNDASKTECGVYNWKNVGLNTKAQVNLSTPLQSGRKVYHKVYAVDLSGLKSNFVVSDGVTVDTTPPMPVDIEYSGENLISNPSFEDGVVNTTEECDDQLPTGWTKDQNSCIKSVQSISSVSKHGEAYLKVKGQIEQTVANLKAGSTYHVVIHVGYPHDVTSGHHSIEGFVKFGEEIHTFILDPQRCQGLCDLDRQPLILWHKFTYVFQPTDTSEVIQIGTNDLRMVLAIDDVSLTELNYIDVGSDSNHLIHHAVFRPYWSSVHLAWHFKDEESPVTDYQWALGTVKGGTQIQSFTSVGKRQHATASDLKLAHNTLLYLTVMSINAAGLTTVSQSDSIIVDMTPPAIAFVNDGIGSDVKYQLNNVLSVNWKVEDKESGVEHCEWAIGTTQGGADIQKFTMVTETKSSAQVTLSDAVVGNSRQFFSTIRCYNKAGLPSTSSSNGILLINKIDINADGQFSVLKESHTPYPVQEACLATRDQLRLQWDMEHGGIDTRSLQISLIGQGSDLDREVRITDLDYTQASLRGLNLKAGTDYNISLSSINVLNRQDSSLSSRITSIDQPPVVKASSSIRTAKSFDGKTLEMSWSDVFVSSWKELYYEVSLGTTMGGSDVIQWQETRVASLIINLPDKMDSPNLYLTVTAIDPCGSFVNLNHTITL